MRGPSPLVPSLIIVGLIAATCGPSILKSGSFLSEVEETTVSFVFVIPLLSLLVIYFVSESVIVPVALVLLVSFVSRMVMGPLVLVLIIAALSSWFPTCHQASRPPPPYSSSCSSSAGVGFGVHEEARDCGNEVRTGYGWGSFWLLLVFLVLLKIFSENR